MKVTKIQAMNNLNKYIGEDLRTLASRYEITTYETGKQNKGWKGQVLERLAGLDNSSSRDPDGVDFELKSVSFRYHKENLVPKETMAITMINPYELANTEFFKSHCWNKLRSMIFCAVLWHGQNSANAELIKVSSFDFQKDDRLVLEIREDYDYIQNKLIKEGYQNLTGKDGKWIQARTKGPGHGSISRAFYARTGLISEIFND